MRNIGRVDPRNKSGDDKGRSKATSTLIPPHKGEVELQGFSSIER
jgi:hypothetical protein